MSGPENLTIASYLGWWEQAGYTDLVAEGVQDWRSGSATPAQQTPAQQAVSSAGPPITATPAMVREPTAALITPLTSWPDDVAAFDIWVAQDAALPGANWSRRIAPAGPTGAALMVVSDMPDAQDLLANNLLSGEVGVLFDAMLAAIGYTRADVRFASIAATRPPGGQWDEVTGQRLRALALHNIDISKPQALLLLGQSTCKLLTGEDVPADGHGLRNINHYGVTTAAVAIHHPRLLLNRAALKRGAWTALKRLREPA